MTTSVIIDGARTPIGKLLGAFSSLTAVDLGAVAIKGALDRAGVAPDQVDAVVFGQVLQAGAGPNPARQAAAAAGLPMTVPAVTVNKLCLSGLVAVAMADQMIRSGQHQVVVAGGMESMTGAPHVLMGARQGYKYGNTVAADILDQDALVCAFDAISMGAATEKYGEPYGITREEQDAFAARSHQLAAEATESGRFAEEIVPVEVKTRKGAVTVTEDEGIRPGTSSESLGGLRPAFNKDGAITAGNASQLSDGAAALIVTSKEWAEQHGLSWIAEIRAHGEVAGPDPSLLLQPANAIKDALKRDGELSASDLDIVEINEAFASVGIASMRELGLDPDKVNVHGGAIAVGHPVGMSGARILLSAAYELKNRGGGNGAVALCGGGGQGEAIVFTTPAS
ncbi:MAG: acetyl-CoA C-acyltransferase [Actinomycetales bacterium]|nr:acetyl-CoA C-acyltransferase [Actinomycetales bacterium]